MKINRKRVNRLSTVAACVIAAAGTFNSAIANEPGRGSDKDIKSSQGAALTNAQYEKNAQGDSQAVSNAQAIKAEEGNQKVPGRGNPASIKSAKGAAKQNVQKAAAQTATSTAKGVDRASSSNETKSADQNPGGMMSHFPASQ